MKHYSTLLIEGRERSGLSRREIARQAGMSEGHLRYIERGERDTRPATLRRLANVLDIEERGLMESWLNDNMPSMNYHDITSRLPKGIEVEQLMDMYRIDEARDISLSADQLTVSDVKHLGAREFFKIREALRNCLNFIRELEAKPR